LRRRVARRVVSSNGGWFVPFFTYRAADAAGAIQQGQLDSDSRGAALEQLVQRGLIPIQVTEQHEPATGSAVWTLTKLAQLQKNSADQLTSREIVALTKALASLLNAGLTVDRALALAGQMNSRPAVKSQLESLGKDVRAGKTLADAMATSRLSLPGYYISMVQAGEVGGGLPQAMTRLGELLRRQSETRERVISALIYPAILAAVVLITLIILVAFVLPRFESLFAESDVPLPLATQVVLAIGNFVSGYWWLLLLLGTIGATATVKYFKSHDGKRRLHRWLLVSRWTFELPLALNTARFLQTLGTLLTNGVPLASALRIVRGTFSNVLLRDAVDDMARRVKAGESMTAAMLGVQVFPAYTVQLVRVGEETGRLDEMLREAAAMLEDDSQRNMERLLALMVPIITVAMGLLIAGLIGSVLIGLLSINDLAL
jgi:general secretion pathway protein F